MVRQRFGCWAVIAVLVAGCATPETSQPTASDQADARFAQHIVPHLLQTTAIVDLARDRITRAGSKLAATEAREGSVPELRQLAQQLQADQQDQIVKMTRWMRAWSRT